MSTYFSHFLQENQPMLREIHHFGINNRRQRPGLPGPHHAVVVQSIAVPGHCSSKALSFMDAYGGYTFCAEIVPVGTSKLDVLACAILCTKMVSEIFMVFTTSNLSMSPSWPLLPVFLHSLLRCNFGPWSLPLQLHLALVNII